MISFGNFIPIQHYNFSVNMTATRTSEQTESRTNIDIQRIVEPVKETSFSGFVKRQKAALRPYSALREKIKSPKMLVPSRPKSSDNNRIQRSESEKPRSKALHKFVNLVPNIKYNYLKKTSTHLNFNHRKNSKKSLRSYISQVEIGKKKKETVRRIKYVKKPSTFHSADRNYKITYQPCDTLQNSVAVQPFNDKSSTRRVIKLDMTGLFKADS